MRKTLIVLESPAKCGKIERFLGSNYSCVATFGHIRELKGLEAIRFQDDGGVSLAYTNVQGKGKQIARLQNAARAATEVILATDDDREGEAIAWHARELLRLPVHTKRIVFHEITQHAVRRALESPRTVDMNRVRAQQAREVIDLTVGYRVSPFLWSKLSKATKKGLSAGRCQTPALRLVAENDAALVANGPGEVVYTVTGTFTRLSLPFKLDKVFPSTRTVEEFLTASASHTAYTVSRGPERRYSEPPPPPFTTSTMQQAASSTLGMAPKRAMAVCQKLYEGGHITYMRTDSQVLAPEFVSAAAGTVRMKYGDEYVGQHLDSLSARRRPAGDGGAQEAHEAIRPTHAGRLSLGDTAERAEARMYDMIWKRAVGACMAPSRERRMSVWVSAAKNRKFVHEAREAVFPGWKALRAPEVDGSADAFRLLQQIAIATGQPLHPTAITATASLRGTKHHYAEAGLIKQLESRGIGRPSTFASIVSKLHERGYTRIGDVPGRMVRCREYRLEKGDAAFSVSTTDKQLGAERNKIVLQPLGRTVVDLLIEHFDDLFRYEYTSDMESQLDNVARGICSWESVCGKCRDDISRLLEPHKECEKMGIELDAEHTYIIGRHGPVIKRVEAKGKVSFLGVRKDVDMDRLRTGGYTVEELAAASTPARKLGVHEGKTVTLKVGRYGPYVEWNGVRRSVPASAGAPDELGLSDVLPLLCGAGSRGVVRKLDSNTSIRTGPNGDYVFHKKPRWKRPKFYSIGGFIRAHGKNSYKSCDLSLLSEWLEEEYSVKLEATCRVEGRGRGTSSRSRPVTG